MKENKKIGILIIGLILGLIIAGGGVYAVSEITGSSITYSNTKSGLLSTDVQGAIDELYSKVDSGIYYYGTVSGINNEISGHFFTDPKQLVSYNSSKVFLQIGLKRMSVCIYKNDEVICFQNGAYKHEKEHMEQVFGESNCSEEIVHGAYPKLSCDNPDFSCDKQHINGVISCKDKSANTSCTISQTLSAGGGCQSIS